MAGECLSARTTALLSSVITPGRFLKGYSYEIERNKSNRTESGSEQEMQIFRPTYFISIAFLAFCAQNNDSGKNLVFFLSKLLKKVNIF